MPNYQPLSDRFWAKVDRNGPLPPIEGWQLGNCWLWTGAKQKTGHGQIGKPRTPVMLGAHRVAYEIQVGAIPEGLLVCHRCDVPSCVRGSHLYVGTRADNMADAVARGKMRHHRAILTDRTVALIRTMFNSGQASISELSRLHGISYATARSVVRRKSWKKVA